MCRGATCGPASCTARESPSRLASSRRALRSRSASQLGLIAGYFGRWVDDLVMRLADVTLAFPTLLLLIAMVAALQPSLIVVFVTVGLVGWAGMARLVRGQVLVVRQLEYVQAAHSAHPIGASSRAMLPERHRPRRHCDDTRHGRRDHGGGGAVVPGPGVQPPTPSWGSMIADGRDLSPVAGVTVDVTVSRPGDRRDCARIQFARRCAAGRARSAGVWRERQKRSRRWKALEALKAGNSRQRPQRPQRLQRPDPGLHPPCRVPVGGAASAST